MTDIDEATVALVRPYAITQGRTRPQLNIALEALIQTTARGRDGDRRDVSAYRREHEYIAYLCDGRFQSLAEIAARMRLPLGVARILVADMAAGGLVAVHKPMSFDDAGTDSVATDLLEKVLAGLRTL